MAKKTLTGKKYFYALGQRCRAKGYNKTKSEEFYLVNAPDYARIAFDKGFRGLSF